MQVHNNMRVSYSSQSNKKRKNEIFKKPKLRFKGSKNQVSFNNEVANSIGAVREALSQIQSTAPNIGCLVYDVNGLELSDFSSQNHGVATDMEKNLY